MQVAQRGTSSTEGGNKTIDRFRTNSRGGATLAITQSQENLSSSDEPYSKGFRKFYRKTVTTAGDDAAVDFARMQYKPEAQDIVNSGWNYTSSNSNVTLSFWARSSVAGVYQVYIVTSDGSSQTYVAEGYTLSADTWTKVTLTIPGNSNVTINNDNGAAFNVYWSMYLGTNYTSSSRSGWAAYANGEQGFDFAQNWTATNGATFDLTGVQLEVGSVATEFEHRSFGEDLQLCQRYYQQYTNPPLRGVISDPNANRMGMPLPVIMRATPTVTITSSGSSGHFSVYDGVATAVYISTIASYCSPDKLELDFDTNPNLTVGNAGCVFQADANASDFGISAEL
jgi:hypothetical protein